MVGSSRIVSAHKIVTPVGNANLDPGAEKAFRRTIIRSALEAIEADINKQTVFRGGSKE